MSVPPRSDATQAPSPPDSTRAMVPPGTTGTLPTTTETVPRTTAPGLDMVPPLSPETMAFDHALSAVIDRLMRIEDRLMQVEDALLVNTADFTAVKALVEELLP